MSKAILLSLGMLALLFMLPIADCYSQVKANSATWIVDDDGPADFDTIQTAINHATSGDKIYVRAGIYFENVIINKSVSLIGEDADSTIIDSNKTGNVVSIVASGVEIIRFTIRNSGIGPFDSGIFVDHSIGNVIRFNVVTDNNYGVNLGYSVSNLVLDNTVIMNAYGIGFYYSSSNKISGNIVTSNTYDAVSLYYSGNNTISSNNIQKNEYGISLYYSEDNTISSNNIQKNEYGISLFDSDDNVVFHNNFINNTQQVYSYDSINVWSNVDGGNYWSDYAGIDFFSGPHQTETGSDGIGDVSYLIDSDNKDTFPLMGIFYDFNVFLEENTFQVAVICNLTISEFKFQVGQETGDKIINFHVTGRGGTIGFLRVTIPVDLMSYPFFVVTTTKKIAPTLLDISNETCNYIYFSHVCNNDSVRIISSEVLHLYNELLDRYAKLEENLNYLNITYYNLLNNYEVLLDNYAQLRKSLFELSSSYQEHLTNYSQGMYNLQSLKYILAIMIGFFIVSIIYLSKQAHEGQTKALGKKLT